MSAPDVVQDRATFVKQAAAQHKSANLHRYAKSLGAEVTWQAYTAGDVTVITYSVAAGGEAFDVASEDEAMRLLRDIDNASGVYRWRFGFDASPEVLDDLRALAEEGGKVEEDLRNLSARYPTEAICIHGDGEGVGDSFRIYAFGGKVELAEAEVVHPEPPPWYPSASVRTPRS